MALYYNENGQLQEYEEWDRIKRCPACKKPYRQSCEQQVPGFRDKSYDYCPYCKTLHGSSMEVDFINYPLTPEEIAEYEKKH